MWPMIIMICVGCVVGIAGLVMAAIQAGRLVKAAQAAGISSRNDVQELTRRVQALGPRIEETARRAQVAAENAQELKVAADKLNYLREEVDEAAWLFTRLKS